MAYWCEGRKSETENQGNLIFFTLPLYVVFRIIYPMLIKETNKLKFD